MKEWLATTLVVGGCVLAAGAFVGAVVAIGASHERAQERQAEEDRRLEWEGPCHDESWLLATTAGSPDRARCTNKLHRMHVEVATHPSNEEAAAIVFCECQRADPIAASSAK